MSPSVLTTTPLPSPPSSSFVAGSSFRVVSISTSDGRTAWYTTCDQAGAGVTEASAWAMPLATSAFVNGVGRGVSAPNRRTARSMTAAPAAKGMIRRRRAPARGVGRGPSDPRSGESCAIRWGPRDRAVRSGRPVGRRVRPHPARRPGRSLPRMPAGACRWTGARGQAGSGPAAGHVRSVPSGDMYDPSASRLQSSPGSM